MFDYTQTQQLYCLGFAAGAAGDYKDTEKNLQARLNNALDNLLPTLPGNWALSWGPKVYKKHPDDDTHGPDCAWFAAENDSQKLCVVAIAGTAAASEMALRELNCAVDHVVDFGAWVRSWSAADGIPPFETDASPEDEAHAYCAKGACLGVSIVLGKTSSGTGQRIDQYLQGLPSGYEVVFAGHSHGASIAPAAALGLVRAKMAGANPVSVLPVAGPATGNGRFAQDFERTFPAPDPDDDNASGRRHRFNTNLFNFYDAVPQAWSVDEAQDRNLDRILTAMYHVTGPVLWAEAHAVVLKAKSLARDSRIKYVPIRGCLFQGQAPPDKISDMSVLTSQLSMHHNVAYWDKIGVSEFMVLVKKELGEPVTV
ncbi:hypothetical protein PG985_016175 [Apiospora marii]